MSHVPECLMTELKSFDSEQLTRDYSTHSHEPIRRLRFSKQQILVEIRKAAQARQSIERSRPKLVVSSPDSLYYHSFPAKKAKGKQTPSVLRSSPSPPPLPKSLKPLSNHSKPHMPTQLEYPSWLKSKAAFQEYTQRSIGVLYSMHKPPESRNKDDTYQITEWLSTLHFFKAIPHICAQELSKVLEYREFTQGERIYAIGEPAKSLLVIYNGSGKVYSKFRKVEAFKTRDIIGEISTGARKFLYVADEDGIGFEIDEAAFKELLLNANKVDKHNNASLIAGLKAFSDWPYIKVQALSALLVPQTYSKNQIIYEKYEESDTFYILKTGRVSIETCVEVEQQNRWPSGTREWTVRQINRKYRTKITEIKAPNYFGAAALIKEIPRKTRAVALTDCICLTLPKAKFLEIFSLKDQERVEELEDVLIPTKPDLQHKVMKHIEGIHSQEKLLLDVMKLDYSIADGRSSIEGHTGTLRRIAQCLKNRKLRAMKDLQEQVVKEEKRCFKVK